MPNRTGTIDRLKSGNFSVRVRDVDGRRFRLPEGPWETWDAAERALGRWISERPADRETAATIRARELRLSTPLKDVYLRSIRNIRGGLDGSTDRQTFYRNVITGEAFVWVEKPLEGRQKRPRFEKVSPVPGRLILGNLPMSAFTSELLEDWAHGLANGPHALSPVTIAKWGRHLSQCFDWALANRYITEHPMPRGIRLVERGTATTNTQRYYFTLNEMRDLWQVVPPRHRTLLETLMFTGLRQGEVRALTPESLVGMKSSLLDVSHTVREETGHQPFLDEPKTAASVRRVPVPYWLMGDLSRVARERQPGHPLFPGEDGVTLMRGSYLNDMFRRWCEDAELVGNPNDRMPGRRKAPTPHDLRATGASLLLSCGASVPEVSGWLGHSSPQITLNVYSKVRPFGEEDPIAAACRREGLTVNQILDKVYAEVCQDPDTFGPEDPWEPGP